MRKRNVIKLVSISLIVVIIAAVGVGACFILLSGDKPKTFTDSAGNIKIIADTSYKKQDVEQYDIYLKGKDSEITGQRQNASTAFPISRELRQFTRAILGQLGFNSTEITLYEKEDVTFEWFVYTKVVEDIEYTCLGVTKKGDAFYFINYVCKTSKFNKSKSKFLDWAKDVTVV